MPRAEKEYGEVNATVNIGDITVDLGQEHLYFEIVRLDPNITGTALAGRAAVPDPQGGPDLVASSVITAGNTFTLSGVWKSWQVIWNRESEQDGEVDINGICYRAGFGPVYSQEVPGMGSTNTEFFNQDVIFTAANNGFPEILIIRKVV